MPYTRPRTVLVVEDSDEDFVALARALKKAGFSEPILRCTQGDQVVPMLEQQRRANNPLSLILLDLNLPAIDGREVLKMVKDRAHLRPIPIVVLSTSADYHDITDCYAHGASSYMLKALDYDQFNYAIKQLCDYWFGVVLLP